jgi:hypothetical protein
MPVRRTGGWLLVLASLSGCGDGTKPADPVGIIQVDVSTSGGDPDPDGYLATLDAGGSGVPLPANGSIFLNAAIGDHTIALGGLASNCSGDALSKSVTVSEGATATVSFTVSCTAISPTTGFIRVVTSTIGSDLDPDGYQFAVDDAAPQAIGTSATVTLDGVAPGLHTVAISGLAFNCGIASGWSEEVSVTGGDTAQAVFPATCYSAGPSTAGSNLSADPVSISIAQASTLTVQVVDASNAPMPGFQVALSATGTGNTIIPWPSVESGITNANGIATFQFSSSIPETKTITAAVNGVPLEHTQEISVLKAASFVGVIAAVPEPSTSGETFQVTVVIAGERGTRPTGGTVTVSSNLEPNAGCDAVPLRPDNLESFATCEMSLTVVSTHQLNATYSGDAQFEGSTGSPVEHVVIAP